MSLGLYERRARARRRLWLGVFKWTVGLGAVIAAGVYAYLSASALVEREVAALRQEIVELNDTIARLQQANAGQQQAMAAARQDLAEWQERYDQDVPAGEMKKLFDLAREKLRAGVEPSRLAFLISSAKNEDACDNMPMTKRFIVQTPFYSGANDAVSFADGSIVVTATGQSATDENGNIEVRFDPAQPVDVRFTELGGETSNATGVLPVHHSVVVDDTEYRFSVLAGESGFVHVTADSCRYP
jgi:hypothetical protein